MSPQSPVKSALETELPAETISSLTVFQWPFYIFSAIFSFPISDSEYIIMDAIAL